MHAKRPEANTCSIVGRCARTGELGVGVASAIPRVGAICPWVRRGIGAVTSQSWVNPYLRLRRTVDIAKARLLPFTEAMPKRAGHVPFPASVRELLAPPPPDRPGGGGSRTP